MLFQMWIIASYCEGQRIHIFDSTDYHPVLYYGDPMAETYHLKNPAPIVLYLHDGSASSEVRTTQTQWSGLSCGGTWLEENLYVEENCFRRPKIRVPNLRRCRPTPLLKGKALCHGPFEGNYRDRVYGPRDMSEESP